MVTQGSIAKALSDSSKAVASLEVEDKNVMREKESIDMCGYASFRPVAILIDEPPLSKQSRRLDCKS